MKPDLSVMPQREPAKVEDRRPLTRREVIELAVRQSGYCGCGCGVKLDALREGVIDEHVIALGLTGSNELQNRSLWRKPCSAAKTAKKDAPAIAKAKRLADIEENGRQASKRPIRSRGFEQPKVKKPWPSRPFPNRKESNRG